jgi:hypothetical protein
MKERPILKFRYLTLVLLMMLLEPLLLAFPREQILQGIQGPWELTVSLGGQDSGLVFSVEVANEDVRQTLNKTFPVVGSPLQVKVLEYCPDLKWKTIVARDPKGGPVASITVAGKGAQQEVILLADVPERRAVTASVGGLAIRQLHNASTAHDLLGQMAKEKAIGLLIFWKDPNALPQEFVIQTGSSFTIPGTSYTAKILEYMPHYSIDRETKEVKNYSDQPANPALKVRLSDGQNTYEQWIWSNFSASPHAMSKFPIRVEFSDFDTGTSENRYFIVTAGNSDLWLYYKTTHGIQLEKVQMKHPYPFKDKDYTFTLDSMLSHGVLSKTWFNNSEKLQHPALVVSVESDKATRETVVEIGQPAHVQTAYGTLVLYYHQKSQTKQQSTQ